MYTQQVKFRTSDDPELIHGGIMIDDKYIICGCCGAVFDVDDDDIRDWSPLNWINIDREILGE